MRLVRRSLLALSLVAVTVPALLHAQTPVTVSGELAFRTRYLFAGIPFAADEVQQAQLTVASGSLTLNAFGVYDFEQSDLTEADIWGDYYVQAAPLVGVFFGAALYNFKIGDAWEATPEVYGGLVLGTVLTPTLYIAHDFDLGDGTHATTSVSHSVPLGEGGATLDFGASMDFNAEYYTGDTGFSYADVVVALGLPVGPLRLSPMFAVQRRLDDDFAQWGVVDDEVFGVTASFTF